MCMCPTFASLDGSTLRLHCSTPSLAQLLTYIFGMSHFLWCDAQAGRRSDEEDMDLDQIDIRALERVSPRTSLMAPEQVLLQL